MKYLNDGPKNYNKPIESEEDTGLAGLFFF